MSNSTAKVHQATIFPTQTPKKLVPKTKKNLILEEFVDTDDSEDSYSDSEYTGSSDDNILSWQDEDLNAGELFYEELEDLEDVEQSTQVEHFKQVSTEDLFLYRNAKPQIKHHPSTSLKSVELLVNSATSYNIENTTSNSLLTNMLGIVMFDAKSDGNDENLKSKNIFVNVLVPYGVSRRSGQINVGDVLIAVNDLCVTTNNIESVLSSIHAPTTLKLTFQTCLESSEPNLYLPFNVNDVKVDAKVEQCIVKVLNPHPSRFEQLYSLPGPTSVFFLTLNVRSDASGEDQDLLYNFPPIDALHGSQSKLCLLRGVFATLSDIIHETFSAKILNTTLLIDDKPIHCAYHKVKDEVFVLCVPALAYSLSQTLHTLSNAVRLLHVMYGSLSSAFLPENKNRNDLLFRHLLLLNASSHELTNKLSASTSYKIPGIKHLLLSNEFHIHVDKALAEFEASDFDDGTKSINFNQRVYTVRGSCIFYNGCLLASHLPDEDTYDVYLYCYNNGLLGTRKSERKGLLLIWREVFRSVSRSRHKVTVAYKEPSGRYFWMIIGLKRSIFCVLLKLNINSFPSSQIPRPDSNYVNYAKAALINIESQKFCNYIEQRLSSKTSSLLVPGSEFLSHETTSWFKSSKPPSGQQTSSSRNFKLTFNSSLKLKNYASDSDDGRRASPSRLSQSRELSNSMASGASSPKTSGVHVLRQRSFGSQGSEEINSSAKLQPDFDNLQLDAVDGEHVTFGNKSNLFCYLTLDTLSGAIITPTDYELYVVGSDTHAALVEQFKHFALILHQRLVVKKVDSDFCEEEGILFQFCAPVHTSSKKTSYVQYWVVGRSMKKPLPKEFYVCFHNSVPLSVVEMAFRSGL